MIKNLLQNYIKDYKITLTENQYEQFQKYFELLAEWNEKMNLTAITDESGVALKHFADSLSLLNFVDIPQNSSLADVGTGAGFPGVVLKIARPDIKLTLIDSLNKRLVFLGEVCAQLGIEAELIHSRAEDGARDEKLRENFDFAVSRAVARMNVLSEYCLPYVKVGGAFCAMKGAQANEEFKESLNAINTLGGKLEKKYFFELPENGGERAIAVVRKVKNTPQKYPRQLGKIKAKAL
ncbi:16S rRNA (guanine(527)-N(7))-methyltransferase RsmG [Ruminococcus sp. NSJ-71]|uniref:Ribosomal RNA small subunit methyltransferase G n=1 Tax=Ruminococcus intestinalis TaxID=2763066 RepID=A0ABR7HNP7_9FIRM|nr:16S rRNA (guanine(527)-N(7))-methyltransferase RsmG [Ruminococcus intestinalis]MBC5729154.1 16S rRNA (guanine(527)-N(7))-methyltransferase RsmG [Ruminococcus intestinalis]